MQMFDNVAMAFASLWANKMRALLTMLGIIIGIGSVIAIVTVGDSLTGSLTDSMQSFGVNNITVSLQQKSSDDSSQGNVRMFGPSSPSAEDLITDAMIEEYKQGYGDQVSAIILTQSVGTAQVQQEGTTVSATMEGVNADYAAANDLTLLHGRFIKDEDDQRQVAVVSDLFCESVFGTSGASVLGQSFEVTVNNQLFKFYVAGVYEYEEDGYVSLTGSDPVTEMFIPLQTARKLAFANQGYQSFTVVAVPGADTQTLLSNTKSFFASFYTHNESYTVTATSMESMLETMTSMMATVQLAISAIAAISLLVGGIGVMNIMLVSITERTREIGTRKALGAPGLAIRVQFITEAVVICAVGGILGVMLGVGLGALGATLMGYAARPSISATLLAVGSSMAKGLFFGYYPANKAAKLDPIEALRYE